MAFLPAGFRLAHAMRFAAGDDHVAVMDEPVEEPGGGGELGLAPAPLFERPVGTDPEGLPFVGGGHEPEQELGAGVVDGAKPTSSAMTRSARRRVSMTRPTELSARPR
jgi:hypothetical protein